MPHHSDSSLARIDTAGPQVPVVVAAAAYRRSGMTCGQDVCVANNCGDLGGVAIALEAGQDDRTPANRLGYRLELVDGEVPEQLRSRLGVNLAGPTPVRLHLAFDQVPAVNATLRIIALDEAGNESAPSAPFEVSFDGCTLAATGDRCESDYDADGEYAAQHPESAPLATGSDVELAQAVEPRTTDVVSSSMAGGGCSLPASGPHGSGRLLFGGLLLAGLWLRRR